MDCLKLALKKSTYPRKGAAKAKRCPSVGIAKNAIRPNASRIHAIHFTFIGMMNMIRNSIFGFKVAKAKKTQK